MELRRVEQRDYFDVSSLMAKYNLSTMTWPEMYSGIGIVAIESKKVVGFIWGFCSGHVGTIDCVVVDENYRHKNECGRSEVALQLASLILAFMVSDGVTLLNCIISNNKYNHSVLRFYRDALYMTERKCLTVVKGNPAEMLHRIKEIVQ